MGEWLPPNVGAKDDSPPVLSATTMVSRDPSAASPSVRPMSGAVAWATGGIGRATASGTATVASVYVLPITAAATSAYVSGASTSGVAPATVGAISAAGSSIRPIIASGITSVTSCSAISEGVPRAPAPACPAEGTGAIAGGV
ncbi:endochitinase A-like [Miscanthus floridulus]|uniref:endochitinase A-like n=1 Tax=Miscanthus floridulus TaxID=154761 RepID=UPI0034574DF7